MLEPAWLVETQSGGIISSLSSCRCQLLLRPDQMRISVCGDNYHGNGECYKCSGCGQGLTGRRVSRLGSGSLVCSSGCGRRVSKLHSSRILDSSISSRVTFSDVDSISGSGMVNNYLREWKPIPRLEDHYSRTWQKETRF